MSRGAFLVILGKQGAGKGTQCVRLARNYAVPHVATGDMLRSEVRAKTELGLKAKAAMDAGELIPDEVVTAMVALRLDRDGAISKGFILDGYPRTVAQAEQLDTLLEPRKLDLVIDIEVPTGVVLRRLAARRVCLDCQAVYSTSSPPKVNWTCDICGGEVVQRDDDTEVAILRRLNLYEEETAPLIDFYSKKGILTTINGVGSTEVVTQRMIKEIDLALKNAGDT